MQWFRAEYVAREGTAPLLVIRARFLGALSLCTCPHSSETGPFFLSFLTENEEPLKKRHYSVMMLGEKTRLAPANTWGKRPPSSCCPHATPESWRSWAPHILLEREGGKEGMAGWMDGWIMYTPLLCAIGDTYPQLPLPLSSSFLADCTASLPIDP